MACSDNVVRAGLTPKLKDVPTLIEMLNYICEPIFAKKFQPSREDECTEVFRPPVKDFAVAKITVSFFMKNYQPVIKCIKNIFLDSSWKSFI